MQSLIITDSSGSNIGFQLVLQDDVGEREKTPNYCFEFYDNGR